MSVVVFKVRHCIDFTLFLQTIQGFSVSEKSTDKANTVKKDISKDDKDHFYEKLMEVAIHHHFFFFCLSVSNGNKYQTNRLCLKSLSL